MTRMVGIGLKKAYTSEVQSFCRRSVGGSLVLVISRHLLINNILSSASAVSSGGSTSSILGDCSLSPGVGVSLSMPGVYSSASVSNGTLSSSLLGITRHLIGLDSVGFAGAVIASEFVWLVTTLVHFSAAGAGLAFRCALFFDTVTKLIFSAFSSMAALAFSLSLVMHFMASGGPESFFSCKLYSGSNNCPNVGMFCTKVNIPSCCLTWALTYC